MAMAVFHTVDKSREPLEKMQQQVANERPYRSHLQPACLPCRRRKARCQSEPSSNVCLMCRIHKTECVFPPTPPPASAKLARRRPQTASSSDTNASTHRAAESTPSTVSLDDDSIIASTGPSTTPMPIFGRGSNVPSELPERSEWPLPPQFSPTQESPLAMSSRDDQQHNLHIVGPAATSDNQVLADYLSLMPGSTRGSRLITPAPGNKSRPVLFTMVQKRPLGVMINQSPSARNLSVIEKLLEPYVNDVIDLYFNKVNTSFPLLDEVSFRRQFTENKDKISPALLTCLYAHTVTFWNSSPTLSKHPCPDGRFIWNLANEATYSELHMFPGMSIIQAIILNVGGRPTTSMIGNGVLLGSAVAMAHSLGLHYNPSQWEIPEPEKNLRMKIWWALWVNDIWLSLAHGTPPHISRRQFNVPKPTIDCFCEPGAPKDQFQKAAIFTALVELTYILDMHLGYIYHFGTGQPMNISHFELALNNWVESLDNEIRRIIIRGTNLGVCGAANLRLSYLTLRLLFERIELEMDKQLNNTPDSRLINQYTKARRTAEEILILTQELEPEHLADFWLASTAFSFPATVSFLLRCALETENSPSGLAQSSSLRIASNLVLALRIHKDKDNWDLGTICLAQHSEIVEKLSTMMPAEDPGADGAPDLQEFGMPDASMLDQFFPCPWDPLQSLY